MCLAIPGKVVKIEQGYAIVDYSGEQKKAKILEDNIDVGDYVIVNAGFAVQKVPEEEAIKSIEAWKSIK